MRAPFLNGPTPATPTFSFSGKSYRPGRDGAENDEWLHGGILPQIANQALEARSEKWYYLRMRSFVLAISLLFTAGCAGTYKASYVTGAVTKQFATESYGVYSGLFNAKLDECDPANNESVTTKTELDECMGPAFEKATHAQIETAVTAYHEAATIHTDLMIASDGTDEERRAATKSLFAAAAKLLALFPAGEKLVNRLESLTGE